MTDLQYKTTIAGLLEKALDKAAEEELENQSREELNVWVPPMTNGESLVFDLNTLKDYLTPDVARGIAENLEIEAPDEMGTLGGDLSAEEFAQTIINAIPMDAADGMGLQTYTFPE